MSDAPPQAESLPDLLTQRSEARSKDDYDTVIATSRTLWQRWSATREFDQLHADARAERAHARRAENTNYVALSESAIGLALLRRKEYDDAATSFRSATKLFREVDNQPELAVAEHHLGETYHSQGDVIAARRHYQAALGTFRTMKAAMWLAKGHIKLAETYELTDDQTRQHYKEALTALMSAKRAAEAGQCAMRLASSHAASGDTKTAIKLYGQAAQVLEHSKTHRLLAACQAELGALLAANGKIRESEFQWDEARETSVALPNDPLSAVADISIALLWDEQARKSYQRPAIVAHAATLLLPAMIYLSAVHKARQDTWKPHLSTLLTWSVTALPGVENAPLRTALRDYAYHHDITLDTEVTRAKGTRKPNTPTVYPSIASILSTVKDIPTPKLTRDALAAQLNSALEPYASAALRRYPSSFTGDKVKSAD